MTDRYLNLVNSPIGAKVASTVGLPRPAVLRRFRAGDPIAARARCCSARPPARCPPR